MKLGIYYVGKMRRQKQKPKYTEGWVEFKNKKHAKQVAEGLNNTHVGGKRKNKFYDTLWSIKYLPK